MRLLKLIDIIHLVEHNKVDSSLCKEVSRLSEMRQASAESVTQDCGDRMSCKKRKKTHLGGLKGLGTLGWADLTFF